MSQKIADFKNLFVSYGGDDVLHGVSLEVNPLEHTAILGANGSGKSTFIKLFSGEIYPRVLAQSHKELFGQDRWEVAELRKRLGIITNDFHSYVQKENPFVTGFELVISSFHSAVGMHQHHKYDQSHSRATLGAMRQMQIEHLNQKPVGKMSTGEIRRCVVARALVHDPSALLLDEPTVGLDIKAQLDFVETIRSLSAEKTIILITHHVEEIFPEIKRVVLLEGGRIFVQGDRESVMTSENLSKVFGVSLKISFSPSGYRVAKTGITQR